MCSSRGPNVGPVSFKIAKDYPGYFKNRASALVEPDAKAGLSRRLPV